MIQTLIDVVVQVQNIRKFSFSFIRNELTFVVSILYLFAVICVYVRSDHDRRTVNSHAVGNGCTTGLTLFWELQLLSRRLVNPDSRYKNNEIPRADPWPTIVHDKTSLQHEIKQVRKTLRNAPAGSLRTPIFENQMKTLQGKLRYTLKQQREQCRFVDYVIQQMAGGEEFVGGFLRYMLTEGPSSTRYHILLYLTLVYCMLHVFNALCSAYGKLICNIIYITYIMFLSIAIWWYREFLPELGGIDSTKLLESARGVHRWRAYSVSLRFI